MAPWFRLEPEVDLIHFDRSGLRIDFIGLPRFEFPVPFVGFEVNTGLLKQLGDCTKLLGQAIDYNHSRIVDERPALASFKETAVPFCFVWFPGCHKDMMDGLLVQNNTSLVREAVGRVHHYNAEQLALMQAGAIRLAGKFNVGFVVAGTNSQTGQDFIELNINGAPLWSSYRGVRAMATQFRPSPGRGSQRR